MMRLDRLLTLHCFHSLGKVLPRPNGIRIPILMYHSISESPEEVSHPYFKTNTSPRVFAHHMELLHSNNYKVIDLSEAVKMISTESSGFSNPPTFHHSSIPQKMAVLTFDDGFDDFRTEGFPILRHYGFPATVFLATGFVSDCGESFNGRKCLCWSEVRELIACGVRFGSHTVNHPKLRHLRWDHIKNEIKDSRNTLEDRTGTRVESFSYPYAFPEENSHFKLDLECCLADSGYTHGVTTMVGTANGSNNRFFLKRIPVNSHDDPALFQAKLEGGYDWVHGLQYGFKMLKIIV
jgi:peptidoglycan/xylan/chitin deacetylase (PgdA/CDA1 family)